MTIIIYKTSVSPPARATLMVVDLLGLTVESREVNLPTREQFKPDYLKKNPLHTVPLLEDGDLILADSHAIITYLVSAYGRNEQRKLYPEDVKERALVDQRLYFDATILFPRLRTVIYSVVKNRMSITNEQVNDICEAYNITEKYLEETTYLAGNDITLADISCVSTLSSLDCIVPIDKKYIKLHNWWNRLKKESWYQKENVPECWCQRRITQGKISPNGKKYMVYLLKSAYTDGSQADGWLCGGALVSTRHVLTSATCLIEASNIFVIAGYKKYVQPKNLDKDECTKTRKKKIIEIIVPIEFNMDAKKQLPPEKWMHLDVGIAVVETPYNFSDLSYRNICSYEPASININYDKLMEVPSTAAAVYGWGGTKARKPGDLADINSKYLMEAQTVITNLTFCANYVDEKLKHVVKNSLICAFGSSEDVYSEHVVNDCAWRRYNLKENDHDCNEYYKLAFRNGEAKVKQSEENINLRRNLYKYIGGGICENDHGGPLITWFGATEIIIGIALTSIYSSKYECQGPFLYISTARSASIIQCLLAQNNETRKLCSILDHNVRSYKIKWPSDSIAPKLLSKQVSRLSQQKQNNIKKGN